MKVFRKEVIAVLGVALTSLSIGLSEDSTTPTYPQREPLPVSLYRPTPGKRVACFVTINSTEEKVVFSKYLNPTDWDLVELTAIDNNGGKEGWFGEACRKNIKCDINVISGHFAGKFFGSSGFELPLAELENRSCAQDCRGVLENPREVYLLGCNALATKEADSRTPQQYYDALRADDYSHELASRVVEDRYGAFGQENRGKVQRAFIKVPYIYGFYSKSPLGKYLGPMLENYMKSLGDYTKHFDEIRDRKITVKSNPNAQLLSALKGQAIAQCSGLDPADPEYKYHLMICQLFDQTTSMGTRLGHANEMLNNERILSLLPSIKNFLRSNILTIKESHATAFAQLQNNQKARNLLLSSIEGVHSPLIRIEWMRFARLMGWITHQSFLANVYDLVASGITEDRISTVVTSTVCGLQFDGLTRMDFSKMIPMITAAHINSSAGANLFSCIELSRYPAFRALVNESLKSKSNYSYSDTDRIATIFYRSSPILNPTETDHELLGRLETLCENYPIPRSGMICGRALANLGAQDSSTAPILAKTLREAGESHQAALAGAYRAVEYGKDLIENTMVDVYLKKNHSSWYAIEDYFLARPIQSASNQKRVLSMLTSPTDSRRPESVVYGLKDMKLSADEFTNAYAAVHMRKNRIMNGYVIAGWMNLGVRAGVPAASLEKILADERGSSISTEDELKAFYTMLKLPAVRSLAQTSKSAKENICRILRTSRLDPVYDEFGDLVKAAVPVKPCEEVLK